MWGRKAGFLLRLAPPFAWEIVHDFSTTRRVGRGKRKHQHPDRLPPSGFCVVRVLRMGGAQVRGRRGLLYWWGYSVSPVRTGALHPIRFQRCGRLPATPDPREGWPSPPWPHAWAENNPARYPAGIGERKNFTSLVIPAKAGIQKVKQNKGFWVPAFAGVTRENVGKKAGIVAFGQTCATKNATPPARKSRHSHLRRGHRRRWRRPGPCRGRRRCDPPPPEQVRGPCPRRTGQTVSCPRAPFPLCRTTG